MKVLLDTHALLWWLQDSGRLGQAAKETIADPTKEILVSIASLWEIVVKVRVGKLQTLSFVDLWRKIQETGFVVLQIEAAHLAALTQVPVLHRDPFDHLLIAQARAEGAFLMSDDRKLQAYEVPVIRCSA